MPLHWHPSEDHAVACERVSCLEGSLRVFVARGISGGYDKLGSAGMSVKFAPDQRVAWNRSWKDDKATLRVDLAADHALWRNICSAVLDRDIFPELASTPSWVKAVFALLVVVPRWRGRLLSLMLWCQLQAIFYAHDFYMYHGYVPVTWPWITQPFGGRPPAWAKRLQLRSLYAIGAGVMTLAYTAGTLFLGMKGEYEEYTPEGDHGERTGSD